MIALPRTKQPTNAADRVAPVLMPRTTGSGGWCLVSGTLKGFLRTLRYHGYGTTVAGQAPGQYCRLIGPGWQLLLWTDNVIEPIGDRDAAGEALARLGVLK